MIICLGDNNCGHYPWRQKPFKLCSRTSKTKALRCIRIVLGAQIGLLVIVNKGFTVFKDPGDGVKIQGKLWKEQFTEEQITFTYQQFSEK